MRDDQAIRKSAEQETDGRIFPTNYKYNLAGIMTEQTYPSGRTVKNILDADGDLSMVQSKKTETAGFFNYAKNFSYAASGAVSSIQLGNGRWESTQFNSRLQPVQIALGNVQASSNLLKLDYDYGSVNNNGNILSQMITTPSNGQTAGFTAVQTYAYDSLNRLKSAEEMIAGNQTWKQAYNFDRYGNRNFDTANNNTTTLANCPVNECNPQIDPATNRFTLGQGYHYDANGNTITDANSRQFTFDGNNKQTKVQNASGQIVGEYFYDGNGKRVKKKTNSEETIFVYDGSGKMIAEYSTQISQTPEVSYLTNDHLGSPRITTGKTGNIISRRDFQPYGEEIQRMGYGTDDVRNRFTGYERDDETGLDFAQARTFNSQNGRFTTVDPLLASGDNANPQSWNRYSYTFNNPLKFIDPTGMITGDFYDREGNFVATDGIKDDKIYLAKEGTKLPCIDRTLNTEEAKQYKNSSTEVGGLIVLTRTEEGENYTSGEFKTIGGVIEKDVSGVMLEPNGPDTTTPNQDQRVPEGVYDLDKHNGKKHKDTFVISNENVPKERAILFHAGTNGKSTEGCIMPGTTKGNGAIGGSRDKTKELKTFIKSEGASNVKFIIRNRISN